MILILLLFSFVMSLVPDQYSIREYKTLNTNTNEGLSSNVIIDIEYLNNSVFLSTSNGLGYALYDAPNFIFYNFQDDDLPDGGNPAMVVKNNIIAVSGSETVSHAGQNHPAGTGISYSIDGGVSWNYMEQSVDEIPIYWSCSNFNTTENLFYSDESLCEAE